METTERYFVVHFRSNDCKNINKPYQIQLLDESGQCRAFDFISLEQQALVLEGKIIPDAVIRAAKKQPLGKGDYVNKCGESIFPF